MDTRSPDAKRRIGFARSSTLNIPIVMGSQIPAEADMRPDVQTHGRELACAGRLEGEQDSECISSPEAVTLLRYVSRVGAEEAIVRKWIRKQEQGDARLGQLRIFKEKNSLIGGSGCPRGMIAVRPAGCHKIWEWAVVPIRGKIHSITVFGLSTKLMDSQ